MYGIFPAKLFAGAHQRLAIYIVQKRLDQSALHLEDLHLPLYASRYYRWLEQFRLYLFGVVEYADVTRMSFPNSIPRIHSKIEKRIWEKLTQFSILGRQLGSNRDSRTIYFHNARLYWIRAMNFVPYFWNERDGEKISTQLKPLYLATALDASAVCATLNSSLFYWWYVVISDCRHVNLREIQNFPIGLAQMDDAIKRRLSVLTDELMADLKLHSQRKERNQKTTGLVVYDGFYPRHSKPIMDKIDCVLAKHYSFTTEELDFVINYCIKLRMGLGERKE